MDCVLSYASLYWISTNMLLMSCTMAGGCRLVLPRYNPVQYWKLLEQFKVNKQIGNNPLCDLFYSR